MFTNAYCIIHTSFRRIHHCAFSAMTSTTSKKGRERTALVLLPGSSRPRLSHCFQDCCARPPLLLLGALRAFVRNPGKRTPTPRLFSSWWHEDEEEWIEPWNDIEEEEAGTSTSSFVVPPVSRPVQSLPPPPPRYSPQDLLLWSWGAGGAGAKKKDKEEEEADDEIMAPPVQVPYDNLQDLLQEHGAATVDPPRRSSIDDDEARRGPFVVVSASNVAAMAGFHPYKDLPDLALRLVYQGRSGRALQESDARLLGLELIDDPEAQLLSIAHKAGPNTVRALINALHVGHQIRHVATASDASALHRAVEEAVNRATNLTSAEGTILREGGRHAVYTGYGTAHEHSALDLYEKQCGWPVRERNAETRLWDFAASSDNEDSIHPTAVPLGPPYVKQREPLLTGVDEASARDDYNSDSRGLAQPACSEPEILPLFRIAGKVDGIRDELVPNHRNRPSSNDRACADDKNDNDDDSWVLRPVVVECKHRMRQLLPTIPLFEQVQVALYCLMFEAEAADLVQVFRRPKQRPASSAFARQRRAKRPHPSTTVSEAPRARNLRKEPPSSPRRTTTIPDFFAASRPSSAPTADSTGSSNESPAPDVDRIGVDEACEEGRPCPIPKDAAQPSSPVDSSCEKSPPDQPDDSDDSAVKDPEVPVENTEDDDAEVAMRVTRIDLDDPVNRHRHNWSEFVLPRLRSFVDAVYAIRSDDGKRYRLLMHASAGAAGDLAGKREAWNLLHEECPWLVGCDTPFQRLGEATPGVATHGGPPGCTA